MHLRDGLQPHSTVAQRYAHLVETGEIADDPAQRPVVAALDRLIDEISDQAPCPQIERARLAVRQEPRRREP